MSDLETSPLYSALAPSRQTNAARRSPALRLGFAATGVDLNPLDAASAGDREEAEYETLVAVVGGRVDWAEPVDF
ncbi:MAG: hypothetical protein ACXVZL_08700 [Gaiellaceae bacterium]